MTPNSSLEKFIHYIKNKRPMYWKKPSELMRSDGDDFIGLGNILMSWAENYLGEDFDRVLTGGYVYFVNEVNKSQMVYEKTKKYPNRNYQKVYDTVYNDEDLMALYHWGVYATTVLWKHHLSIYRFFLREFLPRLAALPPRRLLELGSGSGVWGLLCLNALADWKALGVDISPASVRMAGRMARVNGFSDRVEYRAENALEFSGGREFGAGISCFLLEHLETPAALMRRLGENLEDGAYAFVTGALTAAEVDHIHEFKKESELLALAEEGGFRALACVSACPENHPPQCEFLPRSMAMVLQKRKNRIW